jgi:hypothetical protein
VNEEGKRKKAKQGKSKKVKGKSKDQRNLLKVVCGRTFTFCLLPFYLFAFYLLPFALYNARL